MAATTAASVRQGGDERGERRHGFLRTENQGALDEEVDDEAEDRAAANELADAHGVLAINVSHTNGAFTPDCRLQRRIAP